MLAKLVQMVEWLLYRRLFRLHALHCCFHLFDNVANLEWLADASIESALYHGVYLLLSGIRRNCQDRNMSIYLPISLHLPDNLDCG